MSVVGWSLGGIFARELAREHPGMVRQVITLGSPYAMTDLRQTRVNPVYRLLTKFYVAGADMPPPEHTRLPFPVPSTSVYSRSDGIVAWQTCISTPNARQQNVAVNSSHLGYGYNATVLWLIADRLSQGPNRGGRSPHRRAWPGCSPNPDDHAPLGPASVTLRVGVSRPCQTLRSVFRQFTK